MRHISNYSSSQSMGPTEMLQVGISLKISPHKEPPPPHTQTHAHTHGENGLQKEKQGLSKGEKRHFTWVKKAPIVYCSFQVSKRLLLPPPEGTNEQMWLYKMHIVFGNYSSHNYIKIHSRVHPIELFIKNFLGRAYPRISSINKIEQRYTHSAINNARGMYYTTTDAKQRGVGGLATPLNFGRGGSTPTDFEIIFF